MKTVGHAGAVESNSRRRCHRGCSYAATNRVPSMFDGNLWKAVLCPVASYDLSREDELDLLSKTKNQIRAPVRRINYARRRKISGQGFFDSDNSFLIEALPRNIIISLSWKYSTGYFGYYPKYGMRSALSTESRNKDDECVD